MTIYMTTTVPSQSQQRQILVALGLAGLIIVAEYLARHFVLFWLPVLGALRVNDMLVAGMFYVGLVWLTVPSDQRSLGAMSRAVGEILSCAQHWQVWIAALGATSATLLLGLVDRLLWGGVRLPSVISPWRSEITLLVAAASLLVPVSMLLVNGVIIPFAEEWLWRGYIQPRLIGAIGNVPGILITAVLFSLKHVIVDAALGRLLAISGFGLVLGVLAARRGWRASALAHALANIAATLLTLLASGGQA